MELNGRVKIARIATIFVISTLLIVVAATRLFLDTDGYRKQILGALMVFLIVMLVVSVVELSWRPFSYDSSISNSGNHRDSTSTSMDIPLAYSEAPPAYEDVIDSTTVETNLSEVSTSNQGDNSSEVVAAAAASSGVTRDAPDFKTQRPKGIKMPGAQEDDEEFEEVHIPRRFSPFFSEGSPTPRSYSNSNELHLAVDALPTYEEALIALQAQEARAPSGSDASQQDNNLILFI